MAAKYNTEFFEGLMKIEKWFIKCIEQSAEWERRCTL